MHLRSSMWPRKQTLMLAVLGMSFALWLWAGALTQGVLAATPDVAPPTTHDVDVAGGRLQLAPYLEYLRDPTGQLTAAEAAAAADAGRFVAVSGEGDNLGLTQDAVWAKVTVNNPESVPRTLLLDLDLPWAGYVDFYEGDPTPNQQPTFATGIRRPLSTRAVAMRSFAFPLSLAPGATSTYFLRIASDGPVRLPLTLVTEEAFFAHTAQDDLLFGILLATLGIMSAYNLLVFAVLRDPQQLLLAILGFLVVVSSAFASGIISQSWAPNLSTVFPALGTISICLVIAVFILLAISFLELRRRLRPAYLLLMGAFAWMLFAAVAATAGQEILAYQMVMVLLPPVLITIFVSTVIVARQGLRIAVFFLIAQTLPILFGIVQALSLLGIGPVLPAFEFIVPLNNLILLLLMSLALADRVNVLRREADATNTLLAASEQRLTSYLDALPFSVEVHDRNLNPIYLNKAIRRTNADYTDGQLQQNYRAVLDAVPVVVSGTGDPYPEDHLPILRAQRGESAHADDVTILFGDTPIALEAWSEPLRDADGEVDVIVTAFQDISKRRAVEQELASYRDHLEQRVAQRTTELATVNANLQARVAELTAINEVSRTLARAGNLVPAMREVLQIVTELFDVGYAAIYLQDPRQHQIRIAALDFGGSTASASFSDRTFADACDPNAGGHRQNLVWVADATELISLPDVVRADLDAHGVGPILVAALVVRDVHLGAITLCPQEPAHVYSPDDLRVAQTIASQLAAAIDTANLITEVSAQRDMAESLRQTANALSRSLDHQRVLDLILEQLHQVFDYEGAALSLVDGADLVIVGGRGLSSRFVGRRIPLAGAFASLVVLRSGEPLLIADTMLSPDWVPDDAIQDVRSWLGVPLISSEGPIGVLHLDSTEPNYFTRPQAELLMAFADQAAISVVNARLHERAQFTATVAERDRIARDLHDAVTQTIFSASLIATSLPARLGQIPPAAQSDINMLQALTTGALAELRMLLLELRPEHLRQVQLELLLTQLAQAFTGRTGIPAHLNANCDAQYKPPHDVKVAAYRIAQEALNNVAKHASASQVTVNYSLRERALRVAIIDDGRGFDMGVSSPEHLGLVIMRERAAEVGAEIRIDSEPGLGTQVFLVWNYENTFSEA